MAKKTFTAYPSSYVKASEQTSIKLKPGHWYRFDDRGSTHIGQYYGREPGFECCVCGKGSNAYAFNIWYDPEGGYETWGYGREHMPKIIEDLGEAEVILDE